MMFQLFEAIADRVRQQAAEYAGAQARIGLRAANGVFDPFGMMSAMAAPLPAPIAGTDLALPKPRRERRIRRNSRPAAKRAPRQERRPALNLA